ncbi:MAG: helix-turn-helix domain-containing protein [Clostridia bacterium]|nr:helix-turn-helix domain-containing protein [Clostridia bacterium]
MYPRIRYLREDEDISQTELARKHGMSKTGYSKYETGENDIPTAILIRLSTLYNVSIDYMPGQSDRKDRL